MGRGGAALDEWRAGEPDNTFALLLWGKLQEQRVATDDALAAYRRVVELDPDHDEARLRLTTLLLQRFRGEEALGHLAGLRERLPDNAEVAFQWAAALGLQGRTAEARAALDDCLRQHPEHAERSPSGAGTPPRTGTTRPRPRTCARPSASTPATWSPATSTCWR